MTVVPLKTVHAAEAEVARARRAAAAHRGRCATSVLGGECARCGHFDGEVFTAMLRLDAVLSQQPERHIPIDGADRRRTEREFGTEAA